MKNFKNQLTTAMGNSNVYPHPPRPVEEPWNFQRRGWIKFQISSGGGIQALEFQGKSNFDMEFPEGGVN
jgi:hypothetical protein